MAEKTCVFSQYDYFITEVSFPLEDLTQEQLIKVIQRQQYTIADLKTKTDTQIRNEVLELRILENHYGYQIDKIIGVLSRHELGDYHDIKGGRSGKSPLAGVEALSTKIRMLEKNNAD